MKNRLLRSGSLEVIALAVSLVDVANAQRADPCDVLGRAVLTEERSFSVERIRKSNLTYLCESSITSLEAATKMGWRVGFLVEGIPIEMLWSSDQKTREEARKKICSTVDEQVDRLTIQEAIRWVPLKSVAALYAQCVATQQASAGQIAAYFLPPIDGANVTFQVFYAKDLNIPDPVISRAEVQGATDTVLKDGAGKSIVGKTLRPGASTFPLKRAGNSEVRVVIETDQKQKIPVMTVPPVPLDIEMRFDVYGHLATQQRWGVYQLNDERNCGSDMQSYSRSWNLGTFERFTPAFKWQKYTTSGNCDGRSDVDNVTRASESLARIDYHMVGCGYGMFNTCKGRGWINSTVTASIEDLDPTSSKIWTESAAREMEFVAGAEPFYLQKTVHDHARVSTIEWSARITYPVLQNNTITKRQVILNPNRTQDWDKSANLCFKATDNLRGAVLIEVTDYRNYRCDNDPSPNPIAFLADHDPCLRADNGLPVAKKPDLGTPGPVDCTGPPQ